MVQWNMWFGHIEKKKSEELAKKVYVSDIEGFRRRRWLVI